MIVAEFAARLGLKVDRSAWKKGTDSIVSMSNILRGGFAFAAIKAGQAWNSLAKDAINYGDELGDLQQKTGLSVKFLQELGFAAGGGAEGLQKAQAAATKFGVQMHKAVRGEAKDAAEALKELGISTDDPAVRMGDVEQVMQRVGKAFETMPDGARKNALGMALMGKSGADLSEALTNLSENQRIFRKAGGGVDQEDVNTLGALKKQTEALSLQWDVMKMKAVAAIGPGLAKAFTKVSAFIAENKEQIKAFISQLASAWATLVEGFIAAFDFIVAVFKDHKKEITTLFNAIKAIAVPLFKAIIVVVGVLIVAVAKLVKGFVWFGEAIGKAVAWAVIKFNELMGFIAGIPDMIMGFFGGIGDSIKDLMMVPVNAVRDAWETLLKWIEEKYKWVEGKVQGVKNFFGDVGDFLGGDTASANAASQRELNRKTEQLRLSEERKKERDAQAINQQWQNFTGGSIIINANGIDLNNPLGLKRTVQEAQVAGLRQAGALLP